MGETRYYISEQIAATLRREHGVTDADLVGMNITVDAGMPAGKAYAIAPKAEPKAAPTKWLAMDRIVLNPVSLIRSDLA